LSTRLFLIGLLLIVTGFVIVILGISDSANSSAGLVIFIGPIPLIFGSGPNGSVLAIIALLAAIGMIIIFYLSNFSRRMT
jgi:uncharacterized membrane protein